MKIKFLLDEEEIPKKWYNVAADLPTPLDPPLNPMTKEVLKPEDAEVIFPSRS
jgi:tryptophan synthase beta chain